MNKGKVIQIIGPVLDIEFSVLPNILNAVTVELGSGEDMTLVTVEVAQHLGENKVRCISMQPTDGMIRGAEAIDTGAPIKVPVGAGVLGRILNVIGDFTFPNDVPSQHQASSLSKFHVVLSRKRY